MSEKTNIAWCDSTVNFWSGCTKVSAGCKNCYAEARDNRHMIEPVSHFGKGAPRLKHVGAVKQARALNRKPWISDITGEAFSNLDVEPGLAEFPKGFHRRRIFSLSLGDWLDGEVPIAWLAEMLDTIFQCDQVIWILCTKRPENAISFLEKILHFACMNASRFMTKPGFMDWLSEWVTGEKPPRHIWLLASVENQVMADQRIPELLKIPAVCRGLSLEPLLEGVKLHFALNIYEHAGKPCCVEKSGWHKLGEGLPIESKPRLDWLIIGGESGPGARACNVDWIRSLVAQGKTASVATFVKQLGAQPVHSPEHDGATGFIISLKDKKGGDMVEWPADLRMREFPVIEQSSNKITKSGLALVA